MVVQLVEKMLFPIVIMSLPFGRLGDWYGEVKQPNFRYCTYIHSMFQIEVRFSVRYL